MGKKLKSCSFLLIDTKEPVLAQRHPGISHVWRGLTNGRASRGAASSNDCLRSARCGRGDDCRSRRAAAGGGRRGTESIAVRRRLSPHSDDTKPFVVTKHDFCESRRHGAAGLPRVEGPDARRALHRREVRSIRFDTVEVLRKRRLRVVETIAGLQSTRATIVVRATSYKIMNSREIAQIEAWLAEDDSEIEVFGDQLSSNEEEDHLEESDHQSESEQDGELPGETSADNSEPEEPPQRVRRTDFYAGVDGTMCAEITLDEQLLAFRGRCAFRQYIPNKPAKYGIKVFVKFMLVSNPKVRFASAMKDTTWLLEWLAQSLKMSQLLRFHHRVSLSVAAVAAEEREVRAQESIAARAKNAYVGTTLKLSLLKHGTIIYEFITLLVVQKQFFLEKYEQRPSKLSSFLISSYPTMIQYKRCGRAALRARGRGAATARCGREWRSPRVRREIAAFAVRFGHCSSGGKSL
ncbi:hypothetical protein EVAR_94508_1 [Eumeta japonica]|uniref:PiggyBac transposable element-derived protein domain-containing protein n=1 Tax=Eumeta variegata TaxID=151549 RepID=A0A4C1UVD6_EUMVA|nr:hypothetical protein EVAR_94508_1 [Eumeta japonica]